ncbi:MAG: hypothetical protein NDF58_04465 [archaeon YNP-LCB-024-027]|nr:hypothetical protein [Candidatus Culexarchaeum yellowstonense]
MATYIIITLATLSLIFTSTFTSMKVYADSQYDVRICVSGYVRRIGDGSPLDSTIILLYKEYYNTVELWNKTRSDVNGFYSLSVKFNLLKYLSRLPSIRVFAIHLSNSTNLPDYVPAYLSTSLPTTSSNLTINFTLIPAATILFSGGFMHVNYSNPAVRVIYEVEVGGSLPEGLNCILKYDFKEISQYFQDAGVNGEVVPVPAGYPVNVVVTGVFQEALTVPSTVIFGRTTSITSTIRETYLNLNLFDDFRVFKAGDILTFTVYDVSLKDSFRVVNSMYDRVLSKLDVARMDGFYTTSLYSQLNRIRMLIQDAEKSFNEDSPSAAFATLRNCCVLLQNLSSTIDGLYSDAYSSLNLLLIFFGIGSLAIGYLVSERLILKLGISAALYALLLYLLSTSYPLAYKINSIIPQAILLPIILGGLLEIATSKFPVSKFISNSAELLSISKRNLRRRKLRTTLIMISLIVFTAGFIALTSFSFEVDLLTYVRGNSYNASGLSVEVKVPESYSVAGFSPMDAENNPYAQAVPLSVLNMLKMLGNVSYESFRAESKAKVTPYWRFDENNFVMGIVSFSDLMDPAARLASSAFVDGNLPMRSGEIAISSSLAQSLGLKVGSSIRVLGKQYVVCGLFDDNIIYGLRELSGRPILPYKMVLSMKGGDGVPDIYSSMVCEPREVVFIHWSDIGNYELQVTRVYASYPSNVDINSLGKIIALRGSNILVTVLSGEKCVNMILAEYLATSGFEAILPMILISINAIISAAASLRERENETVIITSLGASPSQMFRIFLNESIIMGFSAGSLGYVAGLLLYKLMSITSSIAVFPKVSFTWVILSLSISLIALIAGFSIVFRSALMVVPSKLWNIRRTTKFTDEGRLDTFDIPVRLDPASVDDFINYICSRLKDYPSSIEESIRIVDKKVESNGAKVYKLIFIYDSGSGLASKNSSRCSLEVHIDGECRVLLNVRSIGSSPEKHSMNIARLIRHMAMEWRLPK